MYSFLILPLYESKPRGSLSLYSNVCFMRSIRVFALDWSHELSECERCLDSSLTEPPLRSRCLRPAMDIGSSSVDCALLMYMNYDC